MQATVFDATLQRFKESPDLYCDRIEEAQLYNTEWRIVTSVNLQEAHLKLQTVKKYAQWSVDFYKYHECMYLINFTDYMKITRYIDRQIKEVEDLKLLGS